MKVGILTHHWLCNFGANLQALATVESLRRMGHEPRVINYRIPSIKDRYDSLVSEPQKRVHQSFCERYLPETECCENSQQVAEVAANERLEVVLSGSDAVLRINPTSAREDLTFPNPFWLQWCDEIGVQRTGFLAASSMGSNFLSLSRADRKRIGEGIERLSYIGIRDRWTTKMLKLCSRSADVNFCPDPVSVFPELMTEEIQKPDSKEPYIIVSLYEKTVTKDWVEAFVAAAHTKGFQVFSLPHPELEVEGPFDRVLRLPMSPLEWYNWLAHAAGYVGVRFHPIMISIVNQVPFVALDQYQTGLRFKSVIPRVAFRPFRRWLRIVSKTFDVATRAEKARYCLNPWQYKKLTPSEIFDLLYQQHVNTEDAGFCQNAKSVFNCTLENICGSIN